MPDQNMYQGQPVGPGGDIIGRETGGAGGVRPKRSSLGAWQAYRDAPTFTRSEMAPPTMEEFSFDQYKESPWYTLPYEEV